MIYCKIYLLLITYICSCTGDRSQRVKRIVGGAAADVPPEDDPVVFTHFGGKSAQVRGVREFPHYVFRGIKYAYPPTGKDRFLRPRQMFLEGQIDATTYAKPCIQPRPGTDQVIGDEDCLAVNVFTPELPTGTEGLPVVVWIHGGGFRYGSASQYGVRHLVAQRLVVVTIQYRLGSIGFLSAGTKELPGNVALWDMVLAVQWVRNYIGFFGGNPYRIVVMGHDTGASSALMIALSQIARGLASGIIAMSGTAVSRWASDYTPQKTIEDVANQNGCPTTNAVTMVKCLQNLPAEAIIRGDSNVEFMRLQSRGFMSGLSGDLGSAPVHEGYNDGRSLPGIVEAKPMNDLEKSNNPKIPLMTGICKDETKRAVKGHLRHDIVDKLQNIPDFFDKVLINNLRGYIPVNLNIKDTLNSTLGGVTNLIPLNFQNYLKTQTKSLIDGLDKVADVTSDALFNVPAFLTVDKWSKNGAPTFLYSFEHFGHMQKGPVFLKGSPLIGNDSYNEAEMNDSIAHGDELAYIFDVNDIEGNPINFEETLSEDDKKVRDVFIDMIANFARTGKPKLQNREILPFTGQSNNFIQIKPKPVLANDFKYCEMALWCNIADRLKSSACSFLNALDTSLKNIGNIVGGIVNQNKLTESLKHQTQGVLGNLGGKDNGALAVLGGGNILGTGSTRKQKPNRVSGLGDLIG